MEPRQEQGKLGRLIKALTAFVMKNLWGADGVPQDLFGFSVMYPIEFLCPESPHER